MIKKFEEYINEAKISKIIGRGHNAVVIDNGDGTVTKTYNIGHIKKCDLCFYEYCMNTYKPKAYHFDNNSHTDPKVFPTVKEIGEDYIIMEKVKCGTEKCKRFIAALDEDFHGRTVWDWACAGGMPKTMNKTPELKFLADVLCWCLQVKNELDNNIKSPLVSWNACDLQESNIGEDKDGNIIFFDI